MSMKQLKCSHKKNIEIGMLKYWDKKGREGTICNGYKAVGGKLRRKYAHRIIMEQHLGREIFENEYIHHKDGNKLNNNIENLELIDKVEHARLHAKERDFGKDRIGISPVNKTPKKLINKIVKLRKDGYSFKDICKITNLSFPTVHKYAKAKSKDHNA